jgi:hypothetical protein
LEKTGEESAELVRDMVEDLLPQHVKKGEHIDSNKETPDAP